ncbi:MAG: gliding motility-associated C-terminal domain-containing protein [Candidatus Latescibacter sp.]|nr:gliding motility-associated C-terminal domain-containing protein [Candidatus Latescibacter sp.]
MRRCIKYCAMIVFLAGLVLIPFAGHSGATVTAAKDSTWNAWPNTIYYVARLSGPNTPYKDPVVYITAADKYTLYINGQLIGSDDKPGTVDKYPLTGSFTDFFIGIKVENYGVGSGNGVMIDIKYDVDNKDTTVVKTWIGTSLMKRRSTYINNVITAYPVLWYYFIGDIQTTLGKADWYNVINSADFFDVTTVPAKPNNISTFKDSQKNPLFRWVISGAMANLNYTPSDKHIEIVSGYVGNLDTGSINGGGFSLRRYDGENIAFLRPSVDYRLTDGDLTVGFPYTGDPTGDSNAKQVDLQDYYLLNKMVIYTGGSNPQNWVTDSPRAFYVQTGTTESYTTLNLIDNVGVSNASNGGYDFAEVSFPPTYARFARFNIYKARIKPPNIGEMMVYGSGYLYKATYESPWIGLGDPTKPKTFGKVTWAGDIPAGAGPNCTITVQTQTRYRLPDSTPSVSSAWSVAHTEKSFDFDSPEPATEFKYKVYLETDHISRTPVFRAISVGYTTDQPIADGKASITPVEVKMGELTNFVYNVDYSLNTGQNLKTMSILVPNYSKVDSVYSSDAKKLILFTADTSKGDKITLTFTNPVTNTDGKSPDNLKIYFRTTLLTNSFIFASFVSNDLGNDNTGALNLREDPIKHWVVTTSNIVSGIVENVQARPKAFTPNGDNRNDYTVIEFRLAKAETKVKIKIYDTAGNLVRKLYEGKLTPRDYVGNNDPGRWDGTKDDKKTLVPPGIYVYQVIGDTDDGLKVGSGAVAVAY